MKHIITSIPVLILSLIIIFSGCKRPESPTMAEAEIRTLVTIVHPSVENITEYIHLNGITIFQKKENIRSTNTGYIKSLSYKQGDFIKSGQLFCTIITKEQQALKGVASLDSTLIKFQKPMPVISQANGNITAINIFEGDYVSEGDILASISEPSSLVVQVNVPYEYNQIVKIGKACDIILPDGKSIHTAITGVMPSIEATSQSQTYLIRLPNQSLPENLNVSIRIPSRQKNGLMCVPTKAIQTDEMQKEFWLMKIVDDSLAIKIPVHTGLQNDSLTEVISDRIKMTDTIVQQGAYGLIDSTLVRFEK
ncbi:MAG: HlyD family efflux transporter periplasmic adaptor subunit [Saprospiraceae bacterium]